MTRITQKQVVEQIKILKEIKPRKEWVVLLKSHIMTEPAFAQVSYGEARNANIMDILSSVFAPRKLAYAFAVVLFLIVGVFGFASHTVPGDLLFPIRKIAEQSQAALTRQTTLKQDVATLNNRINDLAQVAKQGKTNNIPSVISEINNDVSELANNLKNSSADSATIKEIAIGLKTLANVPGTDLTTNPDVKNLYQTVVQSQINDLENATLTDGQNTILLEAEDLYKQGKYIDALEKILLINN